MMLTCLECNKSFAASSSLKVHMLSHSVIRPYVCSLCCKSFTQNIYLTIHMKLHTREAPFSCQHCGKTFKHSGNFKKHMKVHEGIKKFSCPLCSKKFLESYQLKNHIRLHSGLKPFMDKFSGKALNQSGNLCTNEKIHFSERAFHSFKCTKTFLQKDDLEKHSGAHLSVTPYLCLHCNKGYSGINTLAVHMRKVHDLQSGFVCRVCGLVFDDIRIFIRHTNDFLNNGYCEPQDKHAELKDEMNSQSSNPVDHCSSLIERDRMESMVTSRLSLPIAKVFKVENDLVVIEISEVEQKDEKFFERHIVSNLKNNMLKDVSIEPRQKKANNYKSSCFDAHFKCIDEESQRWNKKFCCGFCGKLFKLSKRLETHLKSHKKDEQCNDSPIKKSPVMGDRVVSHFHAKEEFLSGNTSCEIVSDKCYICNLCEESFASESYLISHHCMHNAKGTCECKKCLKLRDFGPDIHSVVNNKRAINGPYSCRICFKSLCSVDMLSHHMKVHSECRPYVCSICRRGYKQLWSIKKHVKIHSNNISKFIGSSRKSSVSPSTKKNPKIYGEIDFKNSFHEIVNEVPRVFEDFDSSDLYFSSADCMEIELSVGEQGFREMKKYSSIDNKCKRSFSLQSKGTQQEILPSCVKIELPGENTVT